MREVETAIASHPEWGIEIGPDGPRLIEGFVPSPVVERLEPEAVVETQSSVTASSVADVLQQSSLYPPEQQGDDGQQDLWDGRSYAAG